MTLSNRDTDTTDYIILISDDQGLNSKPTSLANVTNSKYK
jgi:hypothetical protein